MDGSLLRMALAAGVIAGFCFTQACTPANSDPADQTPTSVRMPEKPLGATAALHANPAADGNVHLYGYKIVATYPHDEDAFTQGLFFHDGTLFETTGLNGASSLRRVDLVSGTASALLPLDDIYFGEGAAALDGKIYSLTWRAGTGFISDPQTLTQEGTFSYGGEGWGLTTDGAQLIMSDGTPRLRFLTPPTMTEDRAVIVTLKGQRIRNLNELEWVRGRVLANLWQEDWVAIIDPDTGTVTGLIDLSGLLPAEEASRMRRKTGKDNVLNGIAYMPDEDRLFVTGKNWPNLYEIQLVAKGIQ
ncbi:MAG: glutaminyl-peptide cyclotransferase [Pseudomonadota bacterium]